MIRTQHALNFGKSERRREGKEDVELCWVGMVGHR